MLQRSGGRPANGDFDKVLTKEPGAENGVVVSTPSHGARTSTSAQVLAERRQINVARHCIFPSQYMAKVRRRPQISHGSGDAIALTLERRCETVKVWSAWPAPQMPQHLRRRKIGLQHARLLLWLAINGQADGGAGPRCYGDQERYNSQKNADVATPTPHYRICP
jgi:hypothetical protein